MSGTVSIKGLSATLDACLNKIERVGVSLSGLTQYADLLQEVDSLTDEILAKKKGLDKLQLSASTKTDLSSRLDGLVSSFQRGEDTQEQFRGINRIGSLSGGLSFSPAFQSRVNGASRELRTSGMGVNLAALKAQALQDLRRISTGSNMKSAGTQGGGMNAYMTMRIVQMGESMMGVGAMSVPMGGGAWCPEGKRGEGEKVLTLSAGGEQEEILTPYEDVSDVGADEGGLVRLADAVGGALESYEDVSDVGADEGGSARLARSQEGELLQEVANVIFQTSDEILDALGQRGGRGFLGSSSSPTSKVWYGSNGGTDWGSLLKTLGTVGLIAGAAFGALSSRTVQEWLAKVATPEGRKSMWEGIKEAVNTVKAVVDPVSLRDVEGVGQSLGQSYTSLSPEAQEYVEDERVRQLNAPVTIKGVSDIEGGWDGVKELGKTGLELGVKAWALKTVTVSLLKRLLTRSISLLVGEGVLAVGGSLVAGAVTGPLAVLALASTIMSTLDEAKRRAFNAVSAQAAYESGESSFYAFLSKDKIGLVSFNELSDNDGGTWGSHFDVDVQRGLVMGHIAESKAYLGEVQVNALLSQLSDSLAIDSLTEKDPERKEVLKTYKQELGILTANSPLEDRVSLLQRALSDGVLDTGRLRYVVADSQELGKKTVQPASWFSSGFSYDRLPVPLIQGYSEEDSLIGGVIPVALVPQAQEWLHTHRKDTTFFQRVAAWRRGSSSSELVLGQSGEGVTYDVSTGRIAWPRPWTGEGDKEKGEVGFVRLSRDTDPTKVVLRGPLPELRTTGDESSLEYVIREVVRVVKAEEESRSEGKGDTAIMMNSNTSVTVSPNGRIPGEQ